MTLWNEKKPSKLAKEWMNKGKNSRDRLTGEQSN